MLNVTRVKFDWGKAVDPDAADKALKADPGIKAVLVTHNETSTGVTNDLEAIASVVRKYDKLLLVDAISSLGCIDLQVDNWGCDVVVTGSQKGWMVPPGLAFVSVSQRAWQAHKAAKMPRFYWDFTSGGGLSAEEADPLDPGGFDILRPRCCSGDDAGGRAAQYLRQACPSGTEDQGWHEVSGIDAVCCR